LQTRASHRVGVKDKTFQKVRNQEQNGLDRSASSWIQHHILKHETVIVHSIKIREAQYLISKALIVVADSFVIVAHLLKDRSIDLTGHTKECCLLSDHHLEVLQ